MASRIDPEQVEAVRRATRACLRRLGELGSVGGRALLDASVAGARWAWPRLREGTIAVVGAMARGLAASARWLWTQRSGVTRIGHRGLWWGALAILVFVGQALLSANGNPELIEVSMTYLIAGLSMSLLVLLGAPETRMRLAAFALASGHGSLAALVFIALG